MIAMSALEKQSRKSSHGGSRNGAGRKKGIRIRLTAASVRMVTGTGLTPLEFLLGIMCDCKAELKDRFAAVVQAAPYVHPKLSALDHEGRLDLTQ